MYSLKGSVAELGESSYMNSFINCYCHITFFIIVLYNYIINTMNARYVLAVQNKIIILSAQNKIKHNQTKRI